MLLEGESTLITNLVQTSRGSRCTPMDFQSQLLYNVSILIQLCGMSGEARRPVRSKSQRSNYSLLLEATLG